MNITKAKALETLVENTIAIRRLEEINAKIRESLLGEVNYTGKKRGRPTKEESEQKKAVQDSNSRVKCEFCSQTFDNQKRGYHNHLRFKHPEQYKKMEH